MTDSASPAVSSSPWSSADDRSSWRRLVLEQGFDNLGAQRANLSAQRFRALILGLSTIAMLFLFGGQLLFAIPLIIELVLVAVPLGLILWPWMFQPALDPAPLERWLYGSKAAPDLESAERQLIKTLDALIQNNAARLSDQSFFYMLLAIGSGFSLFLLALERVALTLS